ncbi:MAG: DUF3267 domain-containing protein [Cyanobacteria bacterium J06573_2]
MKKDLSVLDIEANIYAQIITLPFIGILIGLNIYIWKEQNFLNELSSFISTNFIIFILILFLAYIIHVLIQGLTWQLFANNKSNTIRYGIRRTSRGSVSFQAYCKEPIELKVYKLGITIPGLILGLIPAVLGIFTGNSFVFVFGLFGILYSGEDILILWLLRNIEANSLVKTHSKKTGCYIIDKNEE